MVKGRVFFFGDYQGTNEAVGVVRTSTVPTLAQGGNTDANGSATTAFSFAGMKIYDPATTVQTGSTYTRTEFAGDAIPVRRADPAALALLARYPLPTSSGAANNYTRVGNDVDQQNQVDARGGAGLTRNDRRIVRYT